MLSNAATEQRDAIRATSPTMKSRHTPLGVACRLLVLSTALFAVHVIEAHAQATEAGAAAGVAAATDAGYEAFIARVSDDYRTGVVELSRPESTGSQQASSPAPQAADQEVASLGNEPVARLALVQSTVTSAPVGKVAEPEPAYSRLWVVFLIPVVLPLLPPMLVAPALQRSNHWYPSLVGLWVVAMIASLIEIAAAGESALAGGLLAAPPFIVPCFFLLPMCQSFLDGVKAARESLRAETRSAGWQAFSRLLIPRSLVWLALWAVYLVALEYLMQSRVGAGNWVGSAICVNLAIGMFATCTLLTRRCQTLRGLTMVTGIMASATVLVFIAATVWMITAGISGGILNVHYVSAPLISACFLVVFAIVTTCFAVRNGDAWFEQAG